MVTSYNVFSIEILYLDGGLLYNYELKLKGNRNFYLGWVDFVLNELNASLASALKTGYHR